MKKMIPLLTSIIIIVLISSFLCRNDEPVEIKPDISSSSITMFYTSSSDTSSIDAGKSDWKIEEIPEISDKWTINDIHFVSASNGMVNWL